MEPGGERRGDVENVRSRDELLRELQAVESRLDVIGDPPDLDEIRELVWVRARLRTQTRAETPGE